MSLPSYWLVSQIYNNARDWKIHWLTDDVFALYPGIVEAYLMFIMVCGLKVCLFQVENTHMWLYISLVLNNESYVPKYSSLWPLLLMVFLDVNFGSGSYIVRNKTPSPFC